jgi:hypothetical protein
MHISLIERNSQMDFSNLRFKPYKGKNYNVGWKGKRTLIIAGPLEIEMAHQREHVASQVTHRVVAPGHAAVADVAIVQCDRAQVFQLRDDG